MLSALLMNPIFPELCCKRRTRELQLGRFYPLKMWGRDLSSCLCLFIKILITLPSFQTPPFFSAFIILSLPPLVPIHLSPLLSKQNLFLCIASRLSAFKKRSAFTVALRRSSLLPSARRKKSDSRKKLTCSDQVRQKLHIPNLGGFPSRSAGQSYRSALSTLQSCWPSFCIVWSLFSLCGVWIMFATGSAKTCCSIFSKRIINMKDARWGAENASGIIWISAWSWQKFVSKCLWIPDREWLESLLSCRRPHNWFILLNCMLHQSYVAVGQYPPTKSLMFL